MFGLQIQKNLQVYLGETVSIDVTENIPDVKFKITGSNSSI